MPTEQSDRPRVAISSCLLGVPVRYDGGHRRSSFLVEELGPRVEWVRVCPEVEIGLGTPRDPIDLHETADPTRPRLLQGRLDLTERMRGYARGRIDELRAQAIDGYILKARSPSCGLREVKLVRRDGEVERAGTGIFAQILRESWPELPVFDEADLEDRLIANARVDWIFTMFKFRRRARGLAGLLTFHRAYSKSLALQAPGALVELDALLFNAGAVDPVEDRDRETSVSRNPSRGDPGHGVAVRCGTSYADGDAIAEDSGKDATEELEARYGQVLSEALSRLPG